MTYISGPAQGLADRGYVLGRDLLIEERYAEGNPEKTPTLLAELLTLGADVLVTRGELTTVAAHKAASTVPIVCMTANPVGVGLAVRLPPQGGNVTGLSLASTDYNAKWTHEDGLDFARL